MSEQVLVFPESRLEPYMAHFAKSIVTDPAVIEDILDDVLSPPTSFFMDRPAAETDPRFKQIIPYCVLWTDDAGEPFVFIYKRTKKGGENRLHDKWSLGVGGHINPCDNLGQPGVYGSGFPPLYDVAVRRELDEEVSLKLGPDLGIAAPAVGLIYDPSDEVGRVHFGVVHLVKVAWREPFKSSDPALSAGRWAPFHARKQLYDGCQIGSFENWSKLVFDGVPLVGKE